MPTITVPRSDLSSVEVSEILRDRLGPSYNVLPGMRMTRNPFGNPQPDQPDQIMVGTGSNRMVRAQVTITRRNGQSIIRITPGGVAGELIMNTFGIARHVQRVLANSPWVR
jgi:hypothetical protein